MQLLLFIAPCNFKLLCINHYCEVRHTAAAAAANGAAHQGGPALSSGYNMYSIFKRSDIYMIPAVVLYNSKDLGFQQHVICS